MGYFVEIFDAKIVRIEIKEAVVVFFFFSFGQADSTRQHRFGEPRGNASNCGQGDFENM